MGSRFKWLTFSCSSDAFLKITKAMLQNEIVPEARTGFRIEKLEDRSVIGRFIIKNELREEVEDPFGNNVVFEHITYDTVKFKIDEHLQVLELQNPPRSTKEFTNKIALFAGYSIAIASPTVDISKWILHLENKLGNIVVTKLYGAGISLSIKSNAQLLVSGSEDVRPYFNVMVDNKPCIITKARISFRHLTQNYDLEITNQGTVNITSTYDDSMLDILISTLLVSKT